MSLDIKFDIKLAFKLIAVALFWFAWHDPLIVGAILFILLSL